MDDLTTSLKDTSPPIVLDYGKTKPLGYRAIQKLTRFFPITALPNTDLVRFIVNSNGYWDPYSSYLRFTVRIKTDMVAPVGLGPTNAAQLDNSASSLIQTLSFIQNGVEIERIDRYEVLAGILNDIFYSKEQRIQRTHEGFGTGLPSSHPIYNTATSKGLSCAGVLPVIGEYLNVGRATCVSNTATGTPTFGSVTHGLGAVAGNATLTTDIPTPAPYFDGSNEPIISGIKGTVGNITQYTFCVPIISGVFGVLMPADEIKYIPMQFFPNLEMNFRINPYAFHNLTSSGAAGGPSERNFEVINCELFVNIIHFAPEINLSIAEIVKSRGLYLHTCSYYYGPSHIIQPNSSVETYPINMSFKSLRSILWCFMPSTYRMYPYIREQRRKALNITAAQVRIGGDLFPTFPIGNLGTSSDSGTPWTNSDFLVNLYKAFGRLHDTVNDSLITSHTFCEGNNLVLADYVANPSVLADGKHWPTQVRGYGFTNSVIYEGDPNSTTTQHFFRFNENNFLINQIVPRAVYGIDLDTITSDDSVISGVNTLINKPFELLLEGRNNTSESCELNMFLYHDLVIMIDKDFTIKYLGRGG